MKAIQSNPVNISIALVYCLFGLLSLVVIKIAVRYFTKPKNPYKDDSISKMNKQLKSKHLNDINFSKIFLKTYCLKNTLIGSFFSKDKKYLLKEIFILSCMTVTCFNINTYIIWPWGLGIGLSVLTFIFSQIIIPAFLNKNPQKEEKKQPQIGLQSIQGSIQIQINSHNQLSISRHQQRQLDKQSQHNQVVTSQIQKKPSLQLLFLGFLGLTSQVLISICILRLSFSVSNSGILNLISLGIAVLIDQSCARIGLCLICYFVCLGIQKSRTFNLLQNNIFYACCFESIVLDLKRVHSLAENNLQNNKVSNKNIIHPNIFDGTQTKMVHENEQHEEKVIESITVPISIEIDDKALRQEEEQKYEEQMKQQSQFQCGLEPQNKNQKLIKVQIDGNKTQKVQENKIIDDTDYLQLFAYDVQTFTETIQRIQQTKEKPKKLKKRIEKCENKFKSDPLLYLPFQQHKKNNRISVNDEMLQISDNQIHFSKFKDSVQGNYLSKIEVLECVDDDTIVTEQQQPEFATILNQKNFNIKNLALNQMAQIPPTSRRDQSNTKNRLSKDKINLKIINKKSPYLVNLESQAIMPQKKIKHKVSKINKQNANQTNQSFMGQHRISISRIAQKDLLHKESKKLF